MSEHNTPSYTMSEHNTPRLFTPPILENYTDNVNNNDLTIPMLRSIIKKQQDIIDTQSIIINKHDTEINNLKTSLDEITLLLKGRQFMNRSLSFESIESSPTI